MNDVTRLRRALKLCVEFLQIGQIQANGERHPYSLWYAAVRDGQMALRERLKRGEDGELRWQHVRTPSPSSKPRTWRRRRGRAAGNRGSVPPN